MTADERPPSPPRAKSEFQDESPLDLMALANVERIHSALLAWVLGTNSPFPLPSRLRLIAALTGITLEGVLESSAEVEHDHLDVLIALRQPNRTHHVAVEVKVNASESAGQLASYDDLLARYPACHKVFLTPSGVEPSGGEGWVPRSFADLHRALQQEAGEAIARRECCLSRSATGNFPIGTTA